MQTAPATSRKTPIVVHDDFASLVMLPLNAGNDGEVAGSAITG